MKKVVLILLLTAMHASAFAQLRIEDCYAKAKANYPLIRQYDLVEKSKSYNLANASRGYLPQVSLSARATYQSDVTQLPLDPSLFAAMGITIPVLDKDQYNATIDVNQVIWDGGIIHSQKKMLKATSDVERHQVEADMYAVNDRINQLFFGILLTEEQLQQNDLLLDELKRSYDQISSYIANGIANQADLDAVKVEQLNTLQRSEQMKGNLKAYREMLSLLIATSVSEGTTLERPIIDSVFPELKPDSLPQVQLLQAQSTYLEAQKDGIQASNMPRLGVFAQGGYGRPGLNMLSSDFEAYYMFGARLSWNFGGLYTQGNERKKIDVKRTSVDVQRETYLLNLNQRMAQLKANIESMQEVMKMDDEIIVLRENVKKSAEVKVANGTMSVIEYLREVNSENLARQTKTMHEIQLLIHIADLKYVMNEL